MRFAGTKSSPRDCLSEHRNLTDKLRYDTENALLFKKRFEKLIDSIIQDSYVKSWGCSVVKQQRLNKTNSAFTSNGRTMFVRG